MSGQRYLTKSKLKLALECPTKLFYNSKKEYPDKKIQDTFLEALANGGFQVGELAKCYFPGGIKIDELDYDKALLKTNELLLLDKVTIYEAAFCFDLFFIRADIVVKDGNSLKLFEVKAKSYDPTNLKASISNANGISPKWQPYVYDVTFQRYVISCSRPDLKVKAFLMLADKSKKTSVDGLNQHFHIQTNKDNKVSVKISGDVSPAAIGQEILCRVNIDELADMLLKDDPLYNDDTKSFRAWIDFFAQKYKSDERIQGRIRAYCKTCEFRATPEQEALGLKNGYKECWKSVNGFTEEDFLKPSILNLWDFRKKNEYLDNKVFFQSQLSRTDLEGQKPKVNTEPGLSRVDRQELQVQKSKDNDLSHFFDHEGFRQISSTLTYPLHFIDFETSAVAIPFNANRRPYEQIAFQFSHHVLHQDGTVEHKGQWLNTEEGSFPNFEFIRKLKADLDGDSGNIFRYAAHENSILNAIHRQLKESPEPDASELCSWIETISKSTGDSTLKWEGSRNMIDLLDCVKRFYYSPLTNGSNSIKDILPAILNNSSFLQEKYSRPIFKDKNQSLNFSEKVWIDLDYQGKVISPYKQLEPIFTGIDESLLDDLLMDEEADLSDGGAAMMAYAQMQFTEMKPEERNHIHSSLLKYCELDTLAMVMIWEDWQQQLRFCESNVKL